MSDDPVLQITLPFVHGEEDLAAAVERLAGARAPFRILKRSIDARKKNDIRVHYSVTSDLRDPADVLRQSIAATREAIERMDTVPGRSPAVVVGTGPGGIFCALWLHLHGLHPIVLEQGPPMPDRVRDMARFMKTGELDPYSNICFGAGGAGTYSDGKLITRIRSPYIPFIMATFVEHGAPEEIRYQYNPHLGSNRIRHCIARLLDTMSAEGVDIRYRTRLTGFSADENGRILLIETSAGVIESPSAVFLAAGHSSRETYALLRARGTAMDVKEFAVGVRVEHPAQAINEIQYGLGFGERYPGIETAQYRLATTWKEEHRAAYSFCMCPGGYILNASTDARGIVTNGMSNFLKRGKYSNAAIVVNVSREDLLREGFDGIDGGLEFQKVIEERFRASVNAPGSAHVVPGQRLSDFLDARHARSLHHSSCLNPVAAANLHALFPTFVTDGLRRGFATFDRRMRGFATHQQAQVFGAESRTSSPYRILRDPVLLTSATHPTLYPVGEGAGYAGGITSAAADGIRCAQAYVDALLGRQQGASVPGEDATPWFAEGDSGM